MGWIGSIFPSTLATKKTMNNTPPPTFDETTVRALCLRAMNKGMALRQEQLQGRGGDRSGTEILTDWLNVIMNRKRAGLDPLGG